MHEEIPVPLIEAEGSSSRTKTRVATRFSRDQRILLDDMTTKLDLHRERHMTRLKMITTGVTLCLKVFKTKNRPQRCGASLLGIPSVDVGEVSGE